MFSTSQTHQGNANQYHNEMPPHTYENGYHQKEHKYKMAPRKWQKGNLCAQLVEM